MLSMRVACAAASCAVQTSGELLTVEHLLVLTGVVVYLLQWHGESGWWRADLTVNIDDDRI